MPRECSVIQEDLTRFAGQVERLEGVDQKHIEHCPACEKVRREEETLGTLLSQAVPPADKSLQGLIVNSLRRARLRRRKLALLPVAASLMVSLAGIAMIGSIPGSSLAMKLPHWSSSSWMSLVSALTDWQIALSLAATSLSEAIPFMTLIIAALFSAGGLVTVVTILHRRNKKVSWQRSRS